MDSKKLGKDEILAAFFDEGTYTGLFADGAVKAAYGCAGGQPVYAVYQCGEAVCAKELDKTAAVLEMAAKTGTPVVTFYDCAGAKLEEGLDLLAANNKLAGAIANISGVVPQDNNLDEELNVIQNLMIYSKFYNMPARLARERIA